MHRATLSVAPFVPASAVQQEGPSRHALIPPHLTHIPGMLGEIDLSSTALDSNDRENLRVQLVTMQKEAFAIKGEFERIRRAIRNRLSSSNPPKKRRKQPASIHPS